MGGNLTWAIIQSFPLQNYCCVCVAAGGELNVSYHPVLFTSELLLCMCGCGKEAWRELSSSPFHPTTTPTTTPVYVWLREGSMTWDIVQSIPSHNYSHNYSCVCVAAGRQPDVSYRPVHSIPQLLPQLFLCMCGCGKVAWREVSSNPFHPITTPTTTPVYVWLREGSMTWGIVQSVPSHNYSHNYSCVCTAAGR